MERPLKTARFGGILQIWLVSVCWSLDGLTGLWDMPPNRVAINSRRVIVNAQ